MSAGPPSSESRKTQEELASNYALQVALQTMKERCQQLQARLSVVEEENLQLKIDKQRHVRHESKTSPQNSGDIDKLQEQIAQLSRQKSQLTHHIFMVATENKHLWTRLSLMTEANESLGTRLNKISNTLSNHTNKTEQCLKEMNNDLGSQSLDEISLKLMNNLQQGKSDLEQQFTELSELQSIKDCDFTLTNGDNLNKSETCDINDDEEESYEVSNDLKNCKKQLSNFLTIIKDQREVLHRSVTLLRAYAKGKEDCLVCKRHQQATEKIYHDEGVMTSLSERVERDSIDQEIQRINENSKKVHECPFGECNYFTIDINELAEHLIRAHFPPIRIDDEFVQPCQEQPPSVV